jgi:hypothetical protein
MKRLCLAVSFVLLAGCTTAATDYYQAVEKAAQANAAAAQAKFDALAVIASAGDGQAASAAVMALALSQTPSVTPIPQQSTAIQWASILAAPLSNVAGMYLQHDASKTLARYNARVDMARISADATTQQALYGSFVSMGETTATVASNIDYTPFVDGMVTLGVTGMDNLTQLGESGFDANTAIATTGMNNLYSLGTNGMTNLVTLGTTAIDSIENVGIQGMMGIHQTNEDWLSYLNKSDLIMQDMMKANGCVITTDSNNKVVVTCN